MLRLFQKEENNVWLERAYFIYLISEIYCSNPVHESCNKLQYLEREKAKIKYITFLWSQR